MTVLQVGPVGNIRKWGLETRSSARRFEFINSEESPFRFVKGAPASASTASETQITMSHVMSLPRHRLVQPIAVIVEQTSEKNFVANFAQANVNASGDTIDEAIANLKDIMVAKYEHFSALPRSRLGPAPRRQLAVLKKLIENRD